MWTSKIDRNMPILIACPPNCGSSISVISVTLPSAGARNWCFGKSVRSAFLVGSLKKQSRKPKMIMSDVVRISP